ncbi:TRAP transporter permease [Fodinicurvata sp. EGI_FJ10296]|uniref:TRAP transporter permease n=1 Tax=Fodinicurvata sp. EGI_FJ10296 TaxID=3231908 RepID=UPI003454F89C
MARQSSTSPDNRAAGDEVVPDAESLVAKADTGARQPAGIAARVIFVVAFLWSAFQLWYASPLPFVFGVFIVNDAEARALHLAFALFLAFTAFPAAVDSTSGRKPVLAGIYGIAAVFMAVTAAQQLAAGEAVGWAFLAGSATVLIAAWPLIVPSSTTEIPLGDWLMAIVAALLTLYLYVFYDALSQRMGAPILLDIVTGVCGLLLLLEATRRALGPPLMVIGIIFLAYSYLGRYMPDMIAHSGHSVERILTHQWIGQEGIFGIALGVSTQFVFLFVLFGSLLERAGAGNYFIKVAFSLLGHLRGGPAKAAVLASGMTGVISGSSIANVVTTGTFTIPLMKRVGMPAHKAGAVEVAASVNGQIMPPVMGAAAFLMVEFVGIPYIDVIKHAFLPAVISYIALLYIVHLEALKMDLRAIPKPTVRPFYMSLISLGITVSSIVILSGIVYWGIGWIRDVMGPVSSYVIAIAVVAVYVGLLWYAARYEELELDDPEAEIVSLPESGPTIKTGLHFLLPVVVLIWCLMVERLSPGLSAFYAVVTMMGIMVTQRPILAFFRQNKSIVPEIAVGIRELIEGMVVGARNMISIGIATAAAGIVVGTVTLTGIGLVMTELVEFLSGGNIIIMLVLTALISLVLGLGLPTTANYIVVASLMAPVVVDIGALNGLIMPLIAVHLFVFYFGIMADVTPPVGLASFAASAVARADPLKTGITAFFYSLRTVALPFIFIFNPQLLLIGLTTTWELVLTIVSATTAMLVFAAATQNYFYIRSKWYESVALLLVAFTLFQPGYWMNMLYDQYDELPATELVERVEQKPAGSHIRMVVGGLDFNGDDVTRTVMLPVGEPGSGEDRLQGAGMSLMTMGDEVNIMNVRYGSQAERYGVEIGWDVLAVLEPAEDRPANQWMFIPALALLLAVFLMQWYRAQRQSGRSRQPAAAGR